MHRIQKTYLLETHSKFFWQKASYCINFVAIILAICSIFNDFCCSVNRLVLNRFLHMIWQTDTWFFPLVHLYQSCFSIFYGHRVQSRSNWTLPSWRLIQSPKGKWPYYNLYVYIITGIYYYLTSSLFIMNFLHQNFALMQETGKLVDGDERSSWWADGDDGSRKRNLIPGYTGHVRGKRQISGRTGSFFLIFISCRHFDCLDHFFFFIFFFF